jgi:glycosyltransferase involved in cell wall biosynthesis
MTQNPATLVLNGYWLQLRQMGTGVYGSRLIRGLLRQAPELSFRVLVPEPLRAEVSAEYPAEILEFIPGRPPIRRSIAEDIYWNTLVARHACRRHPQAVFHSPAVMWAPFRPPRSVVTHFDCVYRHFPRLQGGRVRRWWWRATERYAAGADRVLAISRFACEELQRAAGVDGEKIRVLYPWVDAPAEVSAARSAEVARRLALPPEYLLYVGGFLYHKNVDRLIAGYAEAVRQAPLPPLVIAGAIPPLHPKLAVCDVRGAIAAAGLTAGQVRLIGAVAAEDLPTVYRRARLFISPSLHEGFGYPPAEAMAQGTPVIVAGTASLPEVVREARCHFDPRSIPSIAQKIREAAAAPEAFRCALPAEFAEAPGVAAYLAALGELEPALVPARGR